MDAEIFEANREHLRAVAFRMLGSLSDADDAVQEAWIRFQRTDTSEVENVPGWLTTVTARICLDMLRSRQTRREDALEGAVPEHASDDPDPEREAMLADAVGNALLVVLDSLNPAERIAFVLHDVFGVPFDEVAAVLDRTPEATRQLASRARRRVQGSPAVAPADLARQQGVVDAFLTASRAGDFDALIAALDPDVVFTAGKRVVNGAPAVAEQFAGRAEVAEPALIDGRIGIVVAPRGRLLLVMRVEFSGTRIAALDVVAGRAQLRDLELAVLPG
jgi:RNA polymerase sigma factor (sigma-70 family)